MTRNAISPYTPHVGDEVRINWGVEQVIGRVVEVYGDPKKPYVVVEIPIQGSSGEALDFTTAGYRADELELAS